MSGLENDAPAGIAGDDDYTSRPGQKQAPIPVQSDSDSVEATRYDDPEQADSDATLEADEKDAMNKNNIIESRTRGAAKPSGTYQEPGDEEGLPSADDGTSAISTEPQSNLA